MKTLLSRSSRFLSTGSLLITIGLGCIFPAVDTTAGVATLKRALTFHASFDHGLDADLAVGDPRLYSAPAMVKHDGAIPGLPKDGFVTLEKGGGKFGDGLRFHRNSPGMIFFEAFRNLPYTTNDWNGTVSFWLSLSPDEDLEPGYTDPLQITPKGWNNAAFFVEFTKDDKPRQFRYGAYADLSVWNPHQRDWDKIPFEEKPLIKVENPPFRRDQWTHVVFTFEHFNTGKSNGVARLFLNGEPRGTMSARQQTFSWDPTRAMIMPGLSYVGRWDELAIFNRALSGSDIRTLYRLKNGVSDLHR